MVAEEIDFWNAKNALGQFYYQTVLLEVVEQRSGVLLMLFVAAAGDKDVIQIHNATKASANYVHQSLKSLCGVLETKWHSQEFIQAKWSDDGHFGNVIIVDRDLMITPNQINFRVDAHAHQLSQEILDVRTG